MGDRSFSCVEAVQNRAIELFLGVGRYTPTAAVSGDVGWIPCIVSQWEHICILWSRYSGITNGRINKSIFNNALNRGYRITKH